MDSTKFSDFKDIQLQINAVKSMPYTQENPHQITFVRDPRLAIPLEVPVMGLAAWLAWKESEYRKVGHPQTQAI
jgi:hypothetical protein